MLDLQNKTIEFVEAPARKTIAVAVCSFGDREIWDKISEKAIESIHNQTVAPDEFIRIHGNTLHESRNEAARRSKSDYLIYCDSDDFLDENYLREMHNVNGDLCYPLVRHFPPGADWAPVERLNEKPLLEGNYMVIGTMMNRETMLRVGGFRDLPVADDWDLFIRMWLSGAKIVPSDAIYNINIMPNSRNSAPKSVHTEVYNKLIREYEPIARANGLLRRPR